MKKLPEHIEETLLAYVDGKLAAPELQAFEKMLSQNEEVRARLAVLQRSHILLKGLEAESPSKNFTSVVLGRLNHKPVVYKWSLRTGILLLTGLLIVMSIALVLLSAGVFDHTTTLDLNNVGLLQQYINQSLPSIPLDGKLIVNTIILFNLVLAFLVLDRVILKPFFQRRLETGQ